MPDHAQVIAVFDSASLSWGNGQLYASCEGITMTEVLNKEGGFQ